VTLSNLWYAICKGGTSAPCPFQYEHNITDGQPSISSSAENTMMDAAQAVQMHERIVSFLYGCKTKVGERGIRLSGREEVAGGNYKDMVKDP
jgi:hypothetical protein